MRSKVLFVAAAMMGFASVMTPAVAEYNPNVMDLYDAMGNLIDGPNFHRPSSASASQNVNPVPRETVDYKGRYSAGTIVVNTAERRLYLVQATARR